MSLSPGPRETPHCSCDEATGKAAKSGCWAVGCQAGPLSVSGQRVPPLHNSGLRGRGCQRGTGGRSSAAPGWFPSREWRWSKSLSGCALKVAFPLNVLCLVVLGKAFSIILWLILSHDSARGADSRREDQALGQGCVCGDGRVLWTRRAPGPVRLLEL